MTPGRTSTSRTRRLRRGRRRPGGCGPRLRARVRGRRRRAGRPPRSRAGHRRRRRHPLPRDQPGPRPGPSPSGCAAARHYESLVARLADDGIADTGYARTGSMLIAERPGDDEVMDDGRPPHPGPGAGDTEEVDADEARRHFPVLGTVRRALFNPDGRRVDGRTLRAALLAGGRAPGAAGRATPRSPASMPTGVRASSGGVHTEAAPSAPTRWPWPAGPGRRSWPPPSGPSLPVDPLKGQIVHLRLPATDSSTWSIVQPVLGFYLVPWPDGRVACGGTMEADAGFDHRVTADGVLQLLRECLRTAPGPGQCRGGGGPRRVAAGQPSTGSPWSAPCPAGPTPSWPPVTVPRACCSDRSARRLMADHGPRPSASPVTPVRHRRRGRRRPAHPVVPGPVRDLSGPERPVAVRRAEARGLAGRPEPR